MSAELKKQILHPEVIEEMSGDVKIVYTPLCGTGNKPVQRILKELGFRNSPPDPEKAITLLSAGISSYLKAPYRNRRIVHKLKWCLRKLSKQLFDLRKEKQKPVASTKKGSTYNEEILRLWH